MAKSTTKNAKTETAGQVVGQGVSPDEINDPSKSEDGSGKYVKYAGNQFETRVLAAADFKKLNENSKLEKTEWSPQNNHTVDVSSWTKADVEAVVAQPGFKLVEKD